MSSTRCPFDLAGPGTRGSNGVSPEAAGLAPAPGRRVRSLSSWTAGVRVRRVTDGSWGHVREPAVSPTVLLHSSSFGVHRRPMGRDEPLLHPVPQVVEASPRKSGDPDSYPFLSGERQ